MNNKIFHCYNSYTGNKIYIGDEDFFQYPRKYEHLKPIYCELCGVKSSNLCFWAITGHPAYLCKECTERFQTQLDKYGEKE